MDQDLAVRDSKQLLPAEVESPKSGKVTFTLACLTGFLGLHRFYTGRVWTGLAMLVTIGGCFLWWILDVLVLMTGRFKDAQGRVLGPPRRAPRPAGHLDAPKGDEINLTEQQLLADPLDEEFAKLERDLNDDSDS